MDAKQEIREFLTSRRARVTPEAVPAMIGGKPHMIAADELAAGGVAFDDRRGCESAAYPRIWDISNERAPRLVGQFRLEVQDHCSDPGVEEENANGHYAAHYNNVDDYWNDTKLGLFGYTGSGFRFVDLRDPAKPREVAYYKPGANPGTTLVTGFGTFYHNHAVTDACGGYGYWNPRTQQIWFVCEQNGFYVAALSPEARAYMALARPPMTTGPQPTVEKQRCRRSVRVRLRVPRGRRASHARVYVNGKRVRIVRLRRGRATLTLRRLAPGKARVIVLAGRTRGRRLVLHDRRYKTCRATSSASG